MNTIIRVGKKQKKCLGLVVAFIVVLMSVQVTNVSSTPAQKFLIYDGQIVYQGESSFQIYNAEYDIEYKIVLELTDFITVTNVSPDTVRFSSDQTIKITSAYQKVKGIRYSPEMYGFQYMDAEGNVFKWFNNTNTHTCTSVDDVSKTTGITVRTENPMGVAWIGICAYYDVPGGFPLTRRSFGWTTPQTHNYLYCENSASVNIGDHTMEGIVSEFATVNDRKAIVVTAEEIPTGTLEFKDNSFFDVTTGLLLREEYVYVTAEFENRWSRTLSSQTVLDTTPPAIDNPSDLTIEEGAFDQKITWNPSDDHPETYNITCNGAHVEAADWDGSTIIIDVSALSVGVYEYNCSVSDESGQSAMDSVQVNVVEAQPETLETTPETTSEAVITTETETIEKEGGFIPGFTTISTLLSLAVLIWWYRRGIK